MRNMCRCCRFRKCEELGMNKEDVQLNRDPIGKRKEVECCGSSSNQNCCPTTIVKPTPIPVEEALPQVVTSTSIPILPSQQQQQPAPVVYPIVSSSQFSIPQPIALVPFTTTQGPSVIQRLQEGYSNYNSSQKSLFTVMYPDNIFAAEIVSPPGSILPPSVSVLFFSTKKRRTQNSLKWSADVYLSCFRC